MQVTSELDSEQTKSFSHNHRNQTIVLKSADEGEDGTSASFTAKLTLGEFEAVCDFITANFTNDGRI